MKVDDTIDCTDIADLTELVQAIGEGRKKVFDQMMNSIEVKMTLRTAWALISNKTQVTEKKPSKSQPITNEQRAEALVMIRDGYGWEQVRDKLGIPGSSAFGLWRRNKDKNP